MSAIDAIPLFLAAMEACGIRPVEPIANALSAGTLLRFRAEGDRPGRANGWAVLHLDGNPAGAFGHYRLGISERWRADRTKPLSPCDRRALQSTFRAERAKREAEQIAAWERVAGEAERLWNAAQPANPAHRYLILKSMSVDGLRQSGGWLVVPMRDGEGRLWNIQRIAGDGTKRFLKHGRTAGLFWMLGEPDRVICVGEGVATMAAVRRATRHAIVAAFSAKNMEPAARAVRSRFPDAELIVCADDDAHLPRNVGLECARAAAVAVAGRVALPPRSVAP